MTKVLITSKIHHVSRCSRQSVLKETKKKRKKRGFPVGTTIFHHEQTEDKTSHDFKDISRPRGYNEAYEL